MQVTTLQNKALSLVQVLESKLREIRDDGRAEPGARRRPSKLFSKSDFLDCLLDAQYTARKALTEMFGRQRSWSRETAPLIGDLFYYRPPAEVFSEGILVAYYEPVGCNVEAATKEVDNRFRAEVFMKGGRWSQPDKKRAFYDHLERVANLLETKNYPLDFWKACPNNHYLKVVSGFHNPCHSVTEGSCTLRMPHVAVDGSVLRQSLGFCNKLWHTVKRAKTQDLPLPKTDFLNAKRQFVHNGASLKIPFKKHLQKLGWPDEHLSDDALFNLITLYHCYDAPYVVHVLSCFSATKRKSGRQNKLKAPKALIALTLGTRSPDLTPDTNRWLKTLCKAVGLLQDIEAVLAAKRKGHIDLFWQLERVYQKEVPKYRRLIDTLKLVLPAACEDAVIELQSVEGRPKAAESLFNKLCEWANEGKGRGGHKSARWKKAVLVADMEFIKKHMSDLAGIRLVCVYDADLTAVRHTIDELVATGHLEKRKDTDGRTVDWVPKKVRELTDDGLLVKGYRAWHLDVTLGEKRLRLIECKGLDGLLCEIQLKSAAAQAWSQAAHPIIYKPRLPKNVLRGEDSLQETMMKAAERLESGDETITEAKEAYDVLAGR